MKEEEGMLDEDEDEEEEEEEEEEQEEEKDWGWRRKRLKKGVEVVGCGGWEKGQIPQERASFTGPQRAASYDRVWHSFCL
ncbi:hypothetical protein M0804_002567 [Polistes exclamans]|nr:hypothetical protein M0804_002567 [Polistes exclamans]